MKIPQKSKVLELIDAAATVAAGEALAAELGAGAVVALCGQLGAGKTHFTQGLARGLGIDAAVASPTFGLVHEFRQGSVPLFHFDLYRTESLEEVEAIGWDDYLDAGGIVVAEWADRFPDLFPPETIWLELAYSADGESRVLRRL